MARGFGQSQDLSMVFASFYREYASRLEQNATQASRRAEEEQAALDNDTIDRWQQGEMTDEEFLAYAAERVAATAEDPERNAYWKRVQRDTQKSILTEEVSDTAEDLVNQIEAGTKTWDDLLAFYKQSQKSLRPSDPLYEQLSKQIEQVNDQIRDNRIAGEFERVQYQFESNQISGREAGSQLRKMAEMYRANDPARYYQILQQAVSLERYAGFYSAGTRGGGSGRGASQKPLNQLIDALQGIRNRIGSLSEQFEDGVKVGSITVENADGSLSAEEVLLQNPDGTPSTGMKSLDGQMLETLDRLEQAYIEKGDRSAAGGVANARMQYITDHIQPRNTIGPQQQAAAILQTGLSLVEQAADSDDPVLEWGRVQKWARQVGEWESRVNATVTKVRTIAETADEDAPKFLTKSVERPLEGRTTGEFVEQVAGLRDFAAALAGGDAKAAAAAIESFGPSGGAADVTKRVTAAIDLVTGIPTGKYVRAYVPGQGLVYAPVAPSYSTEIGPDGQPQTVLRSVPVFANGSPIFDASAGEELVDVMVQIGGRTQMVKAVAQPSFFVDGQPASEAEYRAALKAGQKEPKAGVSVPKPQEFRSVLIPGRDGIPTQNWIYDAAQGLWFKNRVGKYGGVPLIFVGKNAQLAQQVADQLGIDPKGTSYYNAALAKVGGRAPRPTEDDWYSKSQSASRSELQRQTRAQNAAAFRRGVDAFRGIPLISQALKRFGAELGIRSFDERQPATSYMAPKLAPLVPQKVGGLSETSFALPALPKITLPSAQTPLPRLALPTSPPSSYTAPPTTTVAPRKVGGFLETDF